MSVAPAHLVEALDRLDAHVLAIFSNWKHQETRAADLGSGPPTRNDTKILPTLSFIDTPPSSQGEAPAQVTAPFVMPAAEPKPFKFPSFDEPSSIPVGDPEQRLTVEDLRRIVEPKPEPQPLAPKWLVDAFLTPARVAWIEKQPAGWLVLQLLGRR